MSNLTTGAGRTDFAIPAIETRFNGIKYRSRLEARYAVFFGVLGLEFQYEPEKFDTPCGPYIPDFWLPGCGSESFDEQYPHGVFVEVKGPEPDETAKGKADYLISQLNHSGIEFVFLGPSIGESWPHMDRTHTLQQCPLCGKIGFDIFFCSDETSVASVFSHFCHEENRIAKAWNTEYYFNQNHVSTDSPLVSLAKETAKSARFEDAGWRDLEYPAVVSFGAFLKKQKLFCSGDTSEAIYTNLLEWREHVNTGYREPRWARKGGE